MKSVMFCYVPTGTLCIRSLFLTPTGDMKTLLYRILLYVNSNICIMLNVSCNCGPLKVVISVICFPLSYKLSTGVSSV